MSVTYEIDQGSGLIETRCTGEVSFNEVMEHFRELEDDPTVPERLDVLLDLSGITSLPEAGQLREVTRAIDHLRAKIEWGACAIVANRDALFGMSRMFEVFAGELFARTHVFRERPEAERWIAVNRSSVPRP
jgi:hypothetical protein